MLNAKALFLKLITAIKDMKPGYTYNTNVGTNIWNGTWTCPDDGVIIFIATWSTGGGGGYWYVQDSSSVPVAAMSTSTANGYRDSTMIPAVKGEKYSTYSASKVATATAYYYKSKVTLGA